jgi:hypothetical protein
MKTRILIAGLFIALSMTCLSQKKETTQYGVIHIDTKNPLFEIYLPDNRKLEYETTKQGYLLKLTEILNNLAKEGWEISSSDAWTAWALGGNPSTHSLMVYISRKVASAEEK